MTHLTLQKLQKGDI